MKHSGEGCAHCAKEALSVSARLMLDDADVTERVRYIEFDAGWFMVWWNGRRTPVIPEQTDAPVGGAEVYFWRRARDEED